MNTPRTRHWTRRCFLSQITTTAAAALVVPRHVVAASGQTPPSERLRLAFVGAGGRGAHNLNELAGLEQQVVALCDVDQERAGPSLEKFPQAKHHQDYRRMLDQLESQLDAVVVSTPDHLHAVVALDAMRRGKHVYCEKPLAHSIPEVRAMMRAAHQHKVITQMGNQGHSADGIRTFCEWIWDGAIGKVHTIHAMRNSNYSRIKDLPRLAERPDVPATLNWDLWQGPVVERPYSPTYLPGVWRGWMPFGTGVVGDWVCHILDPVFWALDLGAPASITAQVTGYDPREHGLTFPNGTTVTFTFPARDQRGPITLYWYDGQDAPPQLAECDWAKFPRNTYAVVLGERGAIRYGSHGAAGVRIFPEEKMRAYQRPAESLPRVVSHYQDWLDAVRAGRSAGSCFDYGGPLAELALLAVIATRLPGTTLHWDGPNMRFTNSEAANGLIHWPVRTGWDLPL